MAETIHHPTRQPNGLSAAVPSPPAVRHSGRDTYHSASTDRVGHSRQTSRPEVLRAATRPPVGAHIVVPRLGYRHHGIYVGGGRVIHYAGFGRSRFRGPVEEVSLAEFARGRPVSIRSDGAPLYDQGEVIRRARSRIGEDLYRLWTNNCVHFCEWCLRGEHRSYQVEAWIYRANRVLRSAAKAKAQWLIARSPAKLM
jgi:hypothetical protein